MPRRAAITPTSGSIPGERSPTKPHSKRNTIRASTVHVGQGPDDRKVPTASHNHGAPPLGESIALPPPTSPTKPSKTQPAQKTKTIVRPPKFHQTKLFLDKERQVSDVLDMPGHLGMCTGESYRLAATLTRFSTSAAFDVRTVSWGYGTRDGALGHNNTAHEVDLLKRIAPLRHEEVRQVAAGNKLSIFLTSQGRVMQSGRLAIKQDGVNMWKPREVAFTVRDGDATETADGPGSNNSNNEEIKVVAVEAGHLAAYALDDSGRVYSWGTRRYGQLGHGDDEGGTMESNSTSEEKGGESEQTDTHHSSGNNQEDVDEDDEEDDEDEQESYKAREYVVEPVARRIVSSVLDGVQITSLAAGNHFVLALSSVGRVYSWGTNTHGQLGIGACEPRQTSTPQLVTALSSYIILGLSAGHSHALAVAMVRAQDSALLPLYSDYTMVFSWGRGQRGCLGLGGNATEATPCEVTFFRGLHPTHVASGHDHSLVSCTTGARSYLYAFGGNQFGQLGVARVVDHIDMPTLVDELSNMTLTAIGAGAYVSSALSGDGQVYTWGDATHGKTAREDRRTTYVPWRVGSEAETASTPSIVSSDDGFITQLSMGAHHSLAVYRRTGKPDRWRRFPLGDVVSALTEEESPRRRVNIPLVCSCESAHATTPSAFGMLLYCEQCGMGPICRVCARWCHVYHKLVPKTYDRPEEVMRNSNNQTEQTRRIQCACGSRRPRQAATLRSSDTEKRATIKTERQAAVGPSEAVGGKSEPPAVEPVYCRLIRIPDVVLEE